MSAYRLLYSLLCYVIFPVILLRTFWRSRKSPSARKHWQQRLGFVKLSPSPRIWIHAVSVGETIAAKPLVEKLLADFPHYALLISNTTTTGYQTSTRLFGDSVDHCYFPYDLNGAVSRFLHRSNPSLLIIIETEIWPNLLHQCSQRQLPVLIANARLSERSTKGYLRILPLIKPAIHTVSKIACRNEQDANHFGQLGARSEQIEIVGNIKFDIAVSVKNSMTPLKEQLKPTSQLWVAASTHAGEDEIILQCYAQLKAHHPDLVLILVPRHPERFEAVYKLCDGSGFTTQRRSHQQAFSEDCEIILGDSMGEMAYWYASADIVFVGGSLVETGGHNPLEASVYGVPVVSGAAIFNFDDVYEVLRQNNVAWIAESPAALTDQLDELLTLPAAELSALKTRAVQTLTSQRGSTAALLTLCWQLLNADRPHSL